MSAGEVVRQAKRDDAKQTSCTAGQRGHEGRSHTRLSELESEPLPGQTYGTRVPVRCQVGGPEVPAPARRLPCREHYGWIITTANAQVRGMIDYISPGQTLLFDLQNRYK
jgi:hypothetical protein